MPAAGGYVVRLVLGFCRWLAPDHVQPKEALRNPALTAGHLDAQLFVGVLLDAGPDILILLHRRPEGQGFEQLQVQEGTGDLLQLLLLRHMQLLHARVQLRGE
jgi:hypothetical protein